MDFQLDDEQTAIADLSGRILTEQVTPDRLRELEADAEWFDRSTWTELAKADLLGICLPESVGGGGYGLFEATLVCEQIGRTVAPVPYFATIVLGALAIAEHGGNDLQAELLPAVASGDLVLTAALTEGLGGLPPAQPSTTATADGDGWRLTGEKTFVPAAHLAGRILVPAATGDGESTVFVVDPSDESVVIEVESSTNLEPLATVRLDGVAVDAGAVLGAVGEGARITGWIADRAIAALCATQAGVCEGALRLTAGYVSEREQFGTKIATFQAVAQRVADAYIDTEAVRLTARQAAWRLGEGLDAAESLAIAKTWAADGADRVVHAAQHLHGGIGLDVDYPVHRYFRWARHVGLALGGSSTHLRRLGDLIAAG